MSGSFSAGALTLSVPRASINALSVFGILAGAHGARDWPDLGRRRPVHVRRAGVLRSGRTGSARPTAAKRVERRSPEVVLPTSELRTAP